MSRTLFNEIQFPVDIAYGAIGGPEFFTDVITSSSGFEGRNVNWSTARNRYNLAPAIKTKEQLDYLIKFFRVCQGKAIGFRFKDWLDYKIERQNIAIADGKMDNFQLTKTYAIGNCQVIRKIFKPVVDNIKIYCDQKLIRAEVNPANGQIKFATPPKEGLLIEAEGEFDVPVRFDIDYLATSIENYGVYSHHDIPLIELKL